MLRRWLKLMVSKGLDGIGVDNNEKITVYDQAGGFMHFLSKLLRSVTRYGTVIATCYGGGLKSW